MYTKEQKWFKGFLFHTMNIIEFGIIYLLFIAAEILKWFPGFALRISYCA